MPRHEAEQALKHANQAIRKGNLAAAERWSKAAERLTAAAEKLAAAPVAAPTNEEDEEAMRANLRQRLQRFIETAQDSDAWEEEAKAHHAACEAALANGLEPPPPLRPHPCGPHGTEAYLSAIARGETLSPPDPTP